MAWVMPQSPSAAGTILSRLVVASFEGAEFVEQRGYVVLDNAPERVAVDPEVAVDELIAGCNHERSRYLWIVGADCVRDISRGFADQLQIAQRCVVGQSAFRKCLLIHAMCVRNDALGKPCHVPDVEAPLTRWHLIRHVPPHAQRTSAIRREVPC